MYDNKENVPPTDQVLESSHGKNSGKQVANQKVERIVVEAEDKAIESDSNSQVLSEHEGDDIVEVEAPTDSDSQEKGEAGDDINAEANKTYAEMVKAPKLFNKAEKQRNLFKDLLGNSDIRLMRGCLSGRKCKRRSSSEIAYYSIKLHY
ncbi:hypothetical protein L5515_000427 [Caenorhabditis briggsae]|uniref:Uncharacterized protein n=1 Tax=Caenorhabditis briggsae TaxID=6238 RepID=A0AAE9DYD2_CAEBR|nr:hypothetical protein L5515_000427 [Caenorhabditis briggsae]